MGRTLSRDYAGFFSNGINDEQILMCNKCPTPGTVNKSISTYADRRAISMQRYIRLGIGFHRLKVYTENILTTGDQAAQSDGEGVVRGRDVQIGGIGSKYHTSIHGDDTEFISGPICSVRIKIAGVPIGRRYHFRPAAGLF